MGGSNFGRSHEPQQCGGAHLPNTPSLPNAAVEGGIGDRQNIDFPMTHTPKSPLPPQPYHSPTPQHLPSHQNTNSPNDWVRGPGGQSPPAVSAAAEGRRRLRDRCRVNQRTQERTPQQKPEQTSANRRIAIAGDPGGGAPRPLFPVSAFPCFPVVLLSHFPLSGLPAPAFPLFSYSPVFPSPRSLVFPTARRSNGYKKGAPCGMGRYPARRHRRRKGKN